MLEILRLVEAATPSEFMAPSFFSFYVPSLDNAYFKKLEIHTVKRKRGKKKRKESASP